MTKKRARRSRTIWLNSLALALVALEGKTQLLAPILPVNTYALVATVLPIANILLRAVTTQPIR